MDSKTRAAMEMLSHTNPAKRKIGAKRLRKIKSAEACDALMDCLLGEIDNRKTRELQYQLIMAIGESKCMDLYQQVTELTEKSFETSFIYTALADATIRLCPATNRVELIDKYIAADNHYLAEGAFQAVSLLRFVPDEASQMKYLDYAARLDDTVRAKVWVAAASADWDEAIRQSFLEQCIASGHHELEKVASYSIKGVYREFKPF